MLQEKELKNTGAGQFSRAAAIDAKRYSDECRQAFSPKQQAQAQSFRDLVELAYTGVESEPNYRKTMAVIKVHRGAVVRDRAIARELDAICQERGYVKVRTATGTLYRIPKQ